MFTTKMIVDDLKRRFSAIEQKQLPFATMLALNRTMFRIRDEGWVDEVQRVFDRPVPLTVKAVLYKKATKSNLVAEIFIRNEASSGTPPSKYLFPQVHGGTRVPKGFERRLFKSVARARPFYAPGRAVKDAHGNVSHTVIGKILSQLNARFDVYQNESEAGRGRRLRRQRKKGGGGSYFILAKPRGKLKAGVVYERIGSGFGHTGQQVRTVLHPLDKSPTYTPRFHPTRLSTQLFNLYFPIEFERALREAMRTAR